MHDEISPTFDPLPRLDEPEEVSRDPMPDELVTVLVDAWHLSGASSNRGIGTFLRNLLPRLADGRALDVVGLATATTPLPAGVGRSRIVRRAPGRFAQREHDLLLPRDLARAVRQTGAQVVLSPADNPPRRCPRPWVQMLHDLIPLVVADASFGHDAARWQRVGPRVRSAYATMTNSQNTASDAIRLLDLDPRRVHVAPLGVSARFRPPGQRPRRDPPKLLYVGEYGPHKGFAEAIAVAGAIADHGFAHRLVMVGSLAPWHEPAVRALLASAPRPDRIDLLGFVDDIVREYQGADALVVTSRYEGFCLPALEAMACGTPVVAFANSAIEEVVGDGGVLVPDGDVGAMVSALTALLSTDAVWRDVSARGIERSRSFSWDRCAEAHARILRDAARETSQRSG